MTQLSNGAAKTFATRSGHRHPSSIVAPLSPSFKKNVAHLQTWEKAFRHHKEGKINLLPRVDLPLHTPLLRHCNPVNAPHLGRQTQAANNSHVQRQMWIRTRGVARVMPDILCQTSGARNLMSDIWCQTFGTKHLVSDKRRCIDTNWSIRDVGKKEVTKRMNLEVAGQTDWNRYRRYPECIIRLCLKTPELLKDCRPDPKQTDTDDS